MTDDLCTLCCESVRCRSLLATDLVPVLVAHIAISIDGFLQASTISFRNIAFAASAKTSSI